MHTVRASRFELRGQDGRIAGIWEVGPGGQSHVRMMDARGRQALDLAVLEDASPVIRFTGDDGKDRVFLGLRQGDKPSFVMSDERWQGRVHIGYVQPDFDSKDWDVWDASLRPFGTEHPAVGMVMGKNASGVTDAFVVVAGKRLH